MTAGPLHTAESDLVAACCAEARALLARNLVAEGVLAATPTEAAAARSYDSIFGRDASICALGMAISQDARLHSEAPTGLLTLARYQARNGQIPNFVDPRRHEADFWYVGCIDATLWWVLAVAWVDKELPQHGLAAKLSREVAQAIVWLSCQEHQRFFLLQQNEASDWADIMPRSGFVLYTNALWYMVKRQYGLANVTDTARHFATLFQPFAGPIPEYRRAALLMRYARESARNRDLFLSFVNLSFVGDEGDVFGNLLAILAGLADEDATQRIIRALLGARANDPYPVRVVCNPILEGSDSWRPYMARHRQNFPQQYQNGGIWPLVGAFWVIALAQSGQRSFAASELERLAHANALSDWSFSEWLHGRTLEPQGMRGQSWNAAAFLLAHHALRSPKPLFRAAKSAGDADARIDEDANSMMRSSS